MLKVHIIGNLGADAVRREGSFQPFYSFNVAHTEKFKKRDGTQTERTTWVSCVINWDASKIFPYLRKGEKVYVSGNVRLRTYESNGVIVAGIDCIVSDIELCGAKRTEPNQPEENPFGLDDNSVF